VSPRHDPLSGEGAWIFGGRFNPPDSYSVLYICTTRPCAIAELRRLGQRQSIGMQALMPRHVYYYRITLDSVLDLTDESTRARAQIGFEALISPDWSACQDLGKRAYQTSVQGILSPSATGVDDVLALFIDSLGSSVLEPRLVEEWRTIDDLNEA
jgi:RES domain-containing protein